jgi:hypothetical protein
LFHVSAAHTVASISYRAFPVSVAAVGVVPVTRRAIFMRLFIIPAEYAMFYLFLFAQNMVWGLLLKKDGFYKDLRIERRLRTKII